MKKRAKQIIAVILTIALCVSGLYQESFTVNAAENYEKMIGWEFGGTDSYNGSWTKGGYTSSGITPSYSIANGYLKVDADYTSATSTTYNRVMAMYSFGSSTQADLGDSTKVTFDYYCTAGNIPSSFMLVFTGKIEGASSNTTITETGKFADVATKQSVSEISGYDKYSVSLELTAGDDNANITQREYITRFQVGEIRTNNTFNGTVYYDNLVFWKDSSGGEAEDLGSVGLSRELAIYNTKINAIPENINGTINYQWYKATKADLSDATKIDGATESEYVPAMKYIGAYLYCQVSNGTETYNSNAVRIAAADKLVATDIPFTTTTVSNNYWLLCNTKAYSGKFDTDKMLKGGYFLVNYTGDISGVPSFQFATWSSTTGKLTKQIAATETGTNSDGTKWAKYSYEDCIREWGDEEFSELKALRVYYKADDNTNLVVKSATWYGAPLSYGELGEPVALKGSYSSHQYLFTWHVGGTFDATRIREDSLFYVEYKGDADAVKLVMQSHSNVDSTYVTIGASETGETGTGYYSIFKAQDMIDAFGEDFRYIDGFRIIKGDGKTLSENASMYFFEGEGALVDDISVEGYSDAINVPWTKYDDTDKAGIAVIGASITQNPLVTAGALSGAPYFAPNGGWNAILDRTDVVTYGIGSQTTVNIANRFDEVLKYDYHTIIIQCGNNDLGASNDESAVIAQEVNSYTIMFEKVKAENQARALEGKEPIKVYVLALNPTNSEGFSNTMQSRIENVVAAIDELSSNYEFVTYIDEIHEEFKNKDENGNYITGSPSNPDCSEVHVNPNLVMADGLHPVAEGYAVYAKYLIPLLASDDEADSSLVSLSYRFTSNEMKKSVPDFVSAKQILEENFTVLLPRGTETNATLQMYITPSNLNSIVSIEGYEILTDTYGNDYIEVQLWKNVEEVSIVVTSPNGAESRYNVHFDVDKETVVYENEATKDITVTDSNIDSWPYAQYTLNYNDKLYTGSTLKFDVTLDNTAFTGMYLEVDFDWASIKSFNLTPDEFDDNVMHVEIIYEGEELTGINAIQIKTGGSQLTDYRGNIKISNVVLDNNIPEIEYSITSGADSEWTKGSSEGLDFTSDGSKDKFLGIEIDNEIVDEGNYEFDTDTITVKLLSEYLEELDTGNHTITFVYSDGYVSCSFAVVENETGIIPGVIYKQKTAAVDGKYNVRFVQLITKEQAENSSSVTYTISNGSAEVTRENSLCYSRIVVAGNTICAPDGYVFIAYAVTGVPEGIELTCQMALESL